MLVHVEMQKCASGVECLQAVVQIEGLKGSGGVRDGEMGRVGDRGYLHFCA